MNKTRLSETYLTITYILVLCFLFYGVAQLLSYFKSGADPKNILMLDTESVNDYYQPSVSWEYPYTHQGRPMEDATLQKISKDYVASYYHQFQALKTGNVQGLHDYYTEKSRVQMGELVKWHYDQRQFVSGTTIKHNARIDFYSEDGTIATLTDKVVSYQSHSYQGEVIRTFYDTSDYRVMMLLEDNFWRIRHKVKGDFLESKYVEIKKDSLRRVLIEGKRIFVNQKPYHLKGINYYPKAFPWIKMWESFDSIDFQTDFSLIHSSGFNTMRIFVPFEAFGKAQVDPTQLNKLIRLLDKAHQQDLMVIVTLFDFFLGYPLEEWTLADRHAETIVKRLKDHPALLAWDIKNEPDLDFERFGETVVTDWLKFMITRIKAYDVNTPVTVGWSQPEFLVRLKEDLDFLSFHFYRDPRELQAYLTELKESKPLFIGETGSHSFNKWWYPFSRDQEEQREYYSKIIEIIDRHDLHYAFWTLYDFAKVPSNVAGSLPWKKGPQKAYGLLDVKSNPKMSFEAIKALNNRIDEKKP